MKPKYVSVVALCAILMLNIVFTQFMVHQYFYENYQNTLLYGGLNILLFPVAILIYKKAKRRENG